MSASLAPEIILKELAALWVATAKQNGAASDGGVLRACSMTLVVLAEDGEDQQQLGKTIASLMPEHPARTIIVRLTGSGERSLTERVYSQCWMPFGQRKQICCEQVEITSSDPGLADLPWVIQPLAVADLPLVIWCHSARAAALPQFQALAQAADKIVLDSDALGDSAAGLRLVNNLKGRTKLLGDLAWTKLTRWREMLAQVFENQTHLAELQNVAGVEVEHGPNYAISARYMAEWVAGCLAKVQVKAPCRVMPSSAVPTLRVRLTGPQLPIELSRREDRMVVTVSGVSQCTSLPQPTESLLMREELGIVHKDPVFERTLAAVTGAASGGN